MALIWAYRCSRTRLYFPEDYIENWGTKYGIGLGPVPVSEAVVNDYSGKFVINDRDAALSMHAVGCCRAQVDLVQIEEEEFFLNQAITDQEDPGFIKRGEIMRDKQKQKSSAAMRYYGDIEVAEAKNRLSIRKDAARLKFKEVVAKRTI
jgi:hypothetical protein